jgi:predicted transcriptional regulator
MKTKYTMYLGQKQLAKLETLATKTESTVSELIRRAVDDYLKKESGKQ